MILISSISGSPNSRNAAHALAEVGALDECHFGIAWAKLPKWLSVLPLFFQRQLEDKVLNSVPQGALVSHFWPEVARLAGRNTKVPVLGPWLRSRFSVQSNNLRFDRVVARCLRLHPQLKAVYGYFDTSVHTFREAKRLGLRRIYELPTPYWRTTQRLVSSAREARPEWADTLPDPVVFADVGTRRDEELQLADLVIVPSEFVRESLAEAPPFQARVEVVPYGCPDVAALAGNRAGTGNGIPLRLFFAGTVSQSKGLGDLLEAIAPLGGRVELCIAGDCTGVGQAIRKRGAQQVRFLGRLPHACLLEEMRKQDLFVLPTWYEGLSLALLEALSQGLPVLTTVNSGLAGLIEEGRQGWLVPVGSPDAIRERLEQVLAEPARLQMMGLEAAEWARRHSWASYRLRLQQAVNARV